MRIVRNVFRVAIYLGALGSLLAGWVLALAWLGISSEDVTPALAMISIPFMLWTGLLGKTSPPPAPSLSKGVGESKVPLHKVERDLG